MINKIRQDIYEACLQTDIKVYDYWVVNQQFPYIVIANAEADDIYLKQQTKTDFYFDIHIFDKSKGKKNVIQYQDTITQALAQIDGVNIRISTRVFSDVEPNVIHGIVSLALTKYNTREV